MQWVKCFMTINWPYMTKIGQINQLLSLFFLAGQSFFVKTKNHKMLEDYLTQWRISTVITMLGQNIADRWKLISHECQCICQLMITELWQKSLHLIGLPLEQINFWQIGSCNQSCIIFTVGKNVAFYLHQNLPKLKLFTTC